MEAGVLNRTDRAKPEIAHRRARGRAGMEFQIPSDVNAISPAVDKIVAHARTLGCVPEQESDVTVALFEALANAVIHGNGQQPEKQVHIACLREDRNCIRIIVRDEGAGFDPRAVPDPTSPENVNAEHGRGILMMKAFMDDVRFDKGGTEVHLVKRCNGPATFWGRLAARIAGYARRLTR